MAQNERGPMSAFVVINDKRVCLRLFQTEEQYSAYTTEG